MEAEREGPKMVRDSQKWKKVTIIQPRSYVQVANQLHRSTYQDDPDVGAGVTQDRDQYGQPGQASKKEEQVARMRQRQDRDREKK